MALDSSFQVQAIKEIEAGMLVRCRIGDHETYALTAIDGKKPALIALDHSERPMHIFPIGSGKIAQNFAKDWKIEFRKTVLSDAKDFQEKAGVILVSKLNKVCWFHDTVQGEPGTYFDLTSIMVTDAPAFDTYAAVTAWTLWGPSFSADNSPRWKEFFKFDYQ